MKPFDKLEKEKMKDNKNDTSKNTNSTDYAEDGRDQTADKRVLTILRKIRKNNLSIFLPFQGLSKSHKIMLAAAVFLSLCSGIILPLFISYFGELIKNINLGDDVQYIIVIYFVLGGIQYVLSFFACLFIERITLKVTDHLKLNYLNKVFHLDGEFHDTHPGSKIRSDLDFHLSQITTGIGIKFIMLFTYMSSFLGLYIWALMKSIRLALCISTMFPFILLTSSISRKYIKRYRKKSLSCSNESTSIAEESLVGIKTVASYCGEAYVLKRYKDSETSSSQLTMKADTIHAFDIGAINGLTLATYVLGFWYGTKMLIELYKKESPESLDDFDGSDIISVLLAVLIGMFMLTMILPNIGDYMNAVYATYELYEIIDRKCLIPNDDSGEILDDVHRIEFRDVRFRYATREDVNVFQGLSFSLEEGKTYAFVGESGCGKSTILKIIQRYYDPVEGEVIINGRHNLKNVNVKWWRSKIGVVSQESYLFGCSVKNNIKHSLISGRELKAMGEGTKVVKPTETLKTLRKKKSSEILKIPEEMENIDDSDVVQVGKSVLIHNFISELPNQYDTLVGSNAAKLSGGQKQRISIARAIMRNPKILILDEATSALDNKSEYMVHKTINNLKGSSNRITIMVAHRLSTVRNADRIFVLSNRADENTGNYDTKGSYIIQQGTHDELMKDVTGVYHRMVHIQKLTKENSIPLKDLTDRKHSSRRKKSKNKKHELRVKHDDKDYRNSASSLVSLPSIQEMSIVETPPSLLKKEKKNLKPSIDMIDEKKDGKKSKCGNFSLWSKMRGMCARDRNYKYIYDEMFQYKILVILTLTSIIVAAGIYPLFAIIFSKYVSSLFDIESAEENSRKYSFIILGISVIMFIAESTKTYANCALGEKIQHNIKVKLFENLLYQEIDFFDEAKNSTGILLSYLTRDIYLLKTGFVNNLVVFTHFFVLFFISMVLSFYFSPIISLILSAMYFVLSRILAMRLTTLSSENQPSDNKQNLFNYENDQEINKDPDFLIQEACFNMSTIINYGLEEYYITLIQNALNYQYRGESRKILMKSLIWGLGQSAQLFINGFIYWIGSAMIDNDKIEVDNFMNAVFTFLFTGSYAARILSNKGDAENAKIAFDKYLPLIQRKSLIDSRDEGGIRIDKDKIRGEIEFKNVNFSYVTRRLIPVYNNLSFTCEAKKVTAIVGETGCGKSTVMNILMRFHVLNDDTIITQQALSDELETSGNINVLTSEELFDNKTQKEEYRLCTNSGQVLLDGININKYNLKDLRRNFSFVTQEPMLFNMTIYENIKFGSEDATEEEIKSVCKLAAIDEFIEFLPNKYETNVGNFGKNLSGGQRQRIAIARALLRNPRILLLDEATSALDINSERLIEKAFSEIKSKSNRTIITIAHRLASIKKSDKIIVLHNPDHNGSYVQEFGTHEELIAHHGVYKNYVQLAK